MRVRLALLIPLGACLLGAAFEQIGPYRLMTTDAGIEVSAPASQPGGGVLIAAGLALAALGALRLRRDEGERRYFGWARVLLGLGMAGVGAFAVLGGGAVWEVTPDGVVLRDEGRRETLAPRAQIEAVVVASRRLDGADVKNPATARPWTVQIGGARFALASEEEAQQLAAKLAQVLGVEVRGP